MPFYYDVMKKALSESNTVKYNKETRAAQEQRNNSTASLPQRSGAQKSGAVF